MLIFYIIQRDKMIIFLSTTDPDDLVFLGRTGTVLYTMYAILFAIPTNPKSN